MNLRFTQLNKVVIKLDFINMSYASNSIRTTDEEQTQARHKKVATKTFQLKSPPAQPVVNRTEDISSTESFKSAVTAEIIGDNGRNGYIEVANVGTEDSMPPARLVASLSASPQPLAVATKKVKSVSKNPPKKKTNPTKQPKGGFWEVESIVDVRKNGKNYEFLVKWKGDYENTWEPQKCLNRNALLEAKELLRSKLHKQSETGIVESSVSNEEVEDLHELGDQIS